MQDTSPKLDNSKNNQELISIGSHKDKQKISNNENTNSEKNESFEIIHGVKFKNYDSRKSLDEINQNLTKNKNINLSKKSLPNYKFEKEKISIIENSKSNHIFNNALDFYEQDKILEIFNKIL